VSELDLQRDPRRARRRDPELDLVLVNPGGRARIYQSLGAELAAVEPPVWAGLIASFVRGKACSVAIVDANAEGLGPEEAAARAVEMRPRLVAVPVYGHQPSASTQVMPAAAAVTGALKDAAPELPVIWVGGHVAALPERTLAEERCDFVADGEGLHTLVDLVAALAEPDPRLDRVRGLWLRDGPGARRTAPAPLVTDLDAEMPGIAWDLLPMERYRAHNWHCFGEAGRSPYVSLYTTLGCPYRCSFCCIQAPFKSGEAALGYKPDVNSYRFWSPARVLDDLERLVERWGVRHVKVADELFVLNARHVRALCHGIVERRLPLNIWAYARVDTVKDAMIEQLAAAGVRWLAFGIEAANARVRDDVEKGFGDELVARTLEKVRAAGIHVIGNYIFGLPEDDAASMQETLDLAVALRCEFANFYCAMAYPGSALYERAGAEGWPLPESWSGYSQHSVDTLPLPTRHLSAGEVLRFRDDAFQAYFRDPGYLGHVERTFGTAVRREIESMTAHRLERRFAA
jgi:anaerobic magnesium-protoporphyrin IX monomethyl ester cyclase